MNLIDFTGSATDRFVLYVISVALIVAGVKLVRCAIRDFEEVKSQDDI